MIAGVLSWVFTRSRGPRTIDARRYPSRYPCRTPSLIASSSVPFVTCRSWPRSAKITALPVSWQIGNHFSRATRAFSSSRSRTERPISDSSIARARSKAASMSAPIRWLTVMQRSRTARVMAAASSVRIVAPRDRCRVLRLPEAPDDLDRGGRRLAISEHPFLGEPGERVVVEPEPAAVDLPVVLPEPRAGVCDRAGRPRELRDHAHHPDLAELRIVDRDHVFAGGVLRVLEDPRHVVHGTGHGAALPEARQDLLLAPAGHPLADDGVQFPAVGDPRRVVGKPGIGRQVRPADRRRQPLEDALAGGRYRDPRAAGGAVEVAGRGVREFIAHSLREDSEGRVLRDIRDEEPKEGLVEADIDHLTAARRGAGMDGRHHRES